LENNADSILRHHFFTKTSAHRALTRAAIPF